MIFDIETRLQAVEVVWMDSTAGPGWKPQAVWHDWVEQPGAVQLFVGYLFRVEDAWIAIAQSKQGTPEGNLGEMIQIPTACIVSIRAF